MNHRLAGAALITGAGRRIGRALALAAAAAGYDVYVHYHRSEGDAQTLADRIGALGRRAVLVQADLADAGAAGELLEACIGLGPVTCLVNNAAIYEKDSATDRHDAINLQAPLVLARGFAARLPPDQTGLIVNITDFFVAAPARGFASYGASKAGLAAATETLAVELAPRIRVNAIAPGLVLPSEHEPDSRFERLRLETPLQKGADVADIVLAFEYLLAAKAVTGQTLYVDGGQRLISKRLTNA
jgi:NAD(P)-dependent dehydrogenase (short-subunit alcohol dehydrogenase family)